MKIGTRKISNYFYLVTVNGTNIGFLRKAPGSRSSKTPWQPFTLDNEMISDEASPSGFAAYYGRTGKKDAINALLKATA